MKPRRKLVQIRLYRNRGPTYAKVFLRSLQAGRHVFLRTISPTSLLGAGARCRRVCKTGDFKLFLQRNSQQNCFINKELSNQCVIPKELVIREPAGIRSKQLYKTLKHYQVLLCFDQSFVTEVSSKRFFFCFSVCEIEFAVWGEFNHIVSYRDRLSLVLGLNALQADSVFVLPYIL